MSVADFLPEVLTLGALYALWVFFLAVMNLQRAHAAGSLGVVAFVLGLPLITLAYCLDMAINATVATIVFAELPHERTLSERLARHIAGADGWRRRMAMGIMANLLEPFDTTGGHRTK